MASNSVAWFEFLLNPGLLEKHLGQLNPDPSPIDLIIQFIFNGMKRSDNAHLESEAVDPVTQEITDMKKHFLTILPLQVAAYMNWNLDLFQKKLPLHIQDSLLVALLFETIEEYCNPAHHASLDTGPLLPHQLFSVSLYHQYALFSLVRAKLPSKPHKVSNVPIPGQQDPMQESREVQDGIITVLDRGAENSVRILEQLLTAGEVRAPVLQSFSLRTKKVNGENSNHHWHKCKLVPDEEFKYQIHYILGKYHFLHERFTDALHHFTEASQLLPEISANPMFCQINENKLKGFFASCSAICGRSTPVAKRTLYDRYVHSLTNNYLGLLDILIDDNLTSEIPFYLRLSLQLDVMTKQEKLPENFLFHIQTLNTINCVLQGRNWDNSYIFSLLQAGKQGAEYLVKLLASKVSQYSLLHRSRICTFVQTLAMSDDSVKEIFVPKLAGCAPLASLFTHEHIMALWPGNEEKLAEGNKRGFDTSLGADYNDMNDIIWDLIHSYDIVVLKKAYDSYLNAQLPRPNMVKKEILLLNSKWNIPIPVRNTLMNLLSDTTQRELILLYIAKSEELTMAKSFQQAIELLNEASSLVQNLKRDSSRPCKLLSWMCLVTKIQRQIHELPCVEENEIRNLTVESKQCLAAWNSRDSAVPWTNVMDWCIKLLLNAQDWGSLVGGLAPPSSQYPIMNVLKPLAAAAQALHEKHTHKKPWNDIFEIVVDILISNGQSKRNSSGQVIDRYRDVIMSRTSFLELLESVKEPLCLSILVSLLGHLFNILTNDSSNSLHIDHLAMWPATYEKSENAELSLSLVKEMLGWVLNHATKLYPSASHTILPMCSSWFITKADCAFNKGEFHKAIQNYLTAIFMATDYLRNDTNNPEQNAMHDFVLKRMIRSCMKLQSYTQAAILCQFTENIDYGMALRCLDERNAIDAMDAYYDCLFDVTMMESIINIHQKKGEFRRKEKVMKIMGLLEINSHNNEEIQREAAKVRKHRFLRAMGKQYL